MKTQLLEDIGQSATRFPVPSGRDLHLRGVNGEQNNEQAPAATPVRPRSAFGVWRQKPAGEPVILPVEQPYQAPPAEPIAVEEAQAAKAEPVHEAVIAPAAPQSPVFDFSLPPSTTPAPDLFNPKPRWLERSGQRNLLWGSCMIAAALVILGGLWFYETREDASALALVADEVKAEPQVDKAVKLQAIAPAAPAMPIVPPLVPPLVLIEPTPPTDTKVEPTAVLKSDREKLQTRPKPERASVKRPTDRQAARVPVTPAEKKPEPESAMAATLRACREYGYHPGQCVKRGCSVTKYGFVCRGK